MSFIDIETKEDSPEKIENVAGQPTKHYIFANEFNLMRDKINELKAIIDGYHPVVYNFDMTFDWSGELGITDQASFEYIYAGPVTNFIMEGNRIRCVVGESWPGAIQEPNTELIQAWPANTNFIQLTGYQGASLPDAPANGYDFLIHGAPNLAALPVITPAISAVTFENCPLITEAQMDAAVDQFLTGTLPKGGWYSEDSTPPSAGKQALLTDINNCLSASF
ncbi:MAG: hypothetical protein ITG00_00135 [Flavobacterium sp.]|nr:hypothetical protein [Flavobacterium sp.]